MPIGVTIVYALMISTALILLFCGSKSPRIRFFWAGILASSSCTGLITDFYGKEGYCNYIQAHWVQANWVTWVFFSVSLFVVLVMLYREVTTNHTTRRFLDYLSFLLKEAKDDTVIVSVKDGRISVKQAGDDKGTVTF